MAPIVHSVEIARSPEDVFAYVTDLSRFSEWQEGVVQARVEDDGPLRAGSKTTMTRKVGGREQKIPAEMTDYSPPQTFAFRGTGGPIRPSGKGRIEPVGDGRSRFTFELDFEGRGFGKLMLPLVRRQATKEMPINHQNLKERLENGTG